MPIKNTLLVTPAILFISLLLTSTGHGATVVLENGDRTEGEVTTTSESVLIKKQNGTQKIPRDSVSKILEENKKKKSKEGESKKSKNPIKQRISLNVDEAALPDVIQYIATTTDMGYGFNPADLEKEGSGITMHLNDVRVEKILDLILEDTNLEWTTRGNALIVQPPAKSSRTDIRIYDVRNTMVDTTDKNPKLAPVLEGTDDGDDEGENGNVYGQAETEDDEGTSWGFKEDEDGEGSTRTLRGTRTESFSERGRSLGLIISGSISPNSWADPPVIVVGGSR